eukprot:CAMPEP_0185912870 /NCGR_PEP_ID=MMETSP0196C-20130402/42356_1 /TAXON_ID=2932 /ORGANISM="Alexandrium fundyense, Strain CCMP1719" /LENGTH=46 /DNA_ID= /DNA_START= /DNA_END= /DNA_ORIENTATION=
MVLRIPVNSFSKLEMLIHLELTTCKYIIQVENHHSSWILGLTRRAT